jgi:dTDP-4-amino-4,6-dideoxygalactose transaminase
MKSHTATAAREVRMLDLPRAHAAIDDELKAAFARVLASGQFIMGHEVEAFESEVASYLGVEHAIGASSGTDALLVALMALGIGPGDEVVCPTYTFFATGGCVARLGARPVFVDVSPITYNLVPELVAEALTPRTRAVVTVHLFGRRAPVEPLLELLEGRDISLIEDTAQALGACDDQGRQVGTRGDMGSFSFFPTKTLGGLGDGGLVVSNDGDLAERLRLLRNHGQEAQYIHGRVGGNFRLDALQAALLRVKLPHLDQLNRRRRALAERYRELFEHTGLAISATAAAAGGEQSAPLVLPDYGPEGEHVFHQYVVRLTTAGARDRVRDAMAQRGVQTAVYYPLPLHRQPCFVSQPGSERSLPVSEMLCRETLALPIHPQLESAEQEHVVASLAELL